MRLFWSEHAGLASRAPGVTCCSGAGCRACPAEPGTGPVWHRAGYGPVSRPALTPQEPHPCRVHGAGTRCHLASGPRPGGTSQKPDSEHTGTISTTIRARRTSQSAMKPWIGAFCGLLQNRIVAKMITTEHPKRSPSRHALPTSGTRSGPRPSIAPTWGPASAILQQPA